MSLGFCGGCDIGQGSLRSIATKSEYYAWKEHIKKVKHKKKLDLICHTCGKKFKQQFKLDRHTCNTLLPSGPCTEYHQRPGDSAILIASQTIPLFEAYNLFFQEKVSIGGVSI